jgi:hypothetical protein
MIVGSAFEHLAQQFRKGVADMRASSRHLVQMCSSRRGDPLPPLRRRFHNLYTDEGASRKPRAAVRDTSGLGSR